MNKRFASAMLTLAMLSTLMPNALADDAQPAAEVPQVAAAVAAQDQQPVEEEPAAETEEAQEEEQQESEEPAEEEIQVQAGEDEEEAPVAAQAELTSAGGELTSGTYRLSEDIALEDANLTIPADAEVVLDLNGCTLTGTGIGSVISVAGKLTIQDSKNGGKITGGNSKQDSWKNDNAHNGGAIFIDTTGSVILNGGALSGNRAWNGGGVYIYAGGYLEMNGGVISDNHSLRDFHGGGGGVYALDDTAGTGKFVMNDGVIEENTTLTQGGGAFISGEMVMNGGIIRNNKAMIGGGVCINGTMTMNDGVVTNNSAEFMEDSNYYQIQCGGIKINGGTLNLYGGEISDNTATTTEKVNASGEEIAAAIGAGIYDLGTLNVSGAPVVSGNKVDGTVQNVYLGSGRTIALAGALTANAKLPATLASVTGRVTTCNDYTVSENTVTADDAALTVVTRKGEVYFTEEVAAEDAICSTVVDGAVVYHKTLSAAMASLPSDDDVVTLLDDCQLTAQVGIVNGVSAILSSEKPVKITWEDADAGFFNVSSGAELTIKGQITIQGNYPVAGTEGVASASLYAFNVNGILNIGEKGAADAESPKVQGFNTAALNTDGYPANGTGGAMYVSKGGMVNFYSGILSGNTSSFGGAIYASGEGTVVNLYGGEISGNVARYGAGIAVRTNAVVNLSGTTICRNQADNIGVEKVFTSRDGAGVYLDGAAKLFMTDGSISENSAKNGMGGGVYLSGAGTEAVMTGGSISKNVATTDSAVWNGSQARGGGVYLSGASFTLVDGEIAENQCVKENGSANNAVAAGGISVSGSSNNQGVFTMEGGRVTGNSCPNNGGGVYITNYGTAKLVGGLIKNNTAATGGGVYMAQSTAGGEVLEFSDHPVIIDNQSLTGTSNNLVFAATAKKITLSGALTPGAYIGIGRYTIGAVVAEGTADYTATDADAAYFVVDNDASKLVQKSDSENTLVIANKTGTYHKLSLVLPEHVKANRAPESQVEAGKPCAITFTADAGYKIVSVKIGDAVQTLDENGALTLNSISADTTITVEETTVPVHVDPVKREISGVYGEKMEEPLEITATYSADSIIKSFELADGSTLPAGLTLGKDGVVSGVPTEVTSEDGQDAKVIVTAKNGEKADITLNIKITKAQPKLIITADKTELNGGGDVELTVTGIPDGSTVTVKQTDDQNTSEEKELTLTNGKVTVTLPNSSVKYTFTVSCTESENYFSGTASCDVSVSHYSSSSSSSGSSYVVFAPSSVKNGKVSVDPKNAKKGTTVTITATPDKGYELGDLVVKDASGKSIQLTDKGNGKYTFVMPASKVTVSAEFNEVQTAPVFADVPADAYCADAVAWAVQNGITNGLSDGTFGTSAPCTRGQIVTFLWRAAGSPAPKGTATVPADVVPGSYCYNAVAWALENGITKGLADGTFGVNNTCTRAQGVTFLYRAMGKAPSGTAAFTDVAADSFCADAVAWAVENGVTNGTTATTFSPNASCTRGQIVTFLYRAYQGK